MAYELFPYKSCQLHYLIFSYDKFVQLRANCREGSFDHLKAFIGHVNMKSEVSRRR